MYTVDYVDKHIDSLCDKLGSDYFPIDIKFGRFITMTYDFIRGNSIYLEGSQEISDDIKPLVVKLPFVMVPGIGQGVYEIAEPNDYIRLISLEPLAGVNKVRKFKKVHMVKEGQRPAYERDPFRKPSPFYPHVYRNGNIFEVNIGEDTDNYLEARLTYIKEPTFGNIDNIDDIMVNLPKIAVEKIMLKTAESLRFTTADETAASVYQFDQTFGKRNK